MPALLLLLLLPLNNACAEEYPFQAAMDHGNLSLLFVEGWTTFPSDASSFYLVKEMRDAIRAERLPIQNVPLAAIADGIESDLQSAKAAIERRPFQTANAEGVQFVGEIERKGAKYRFIQTLVSDNDRAYLLTFVTSPERFETLQPEVEAILESAAVGDEKPPLEERVAALEERLGIKETPPPEPAAPKPDLAEVADKTAPAEQPEKTADKTEESPPPEPEPTPTDPEPKKAPDKETPPSVSQQAFLGVKIQELTSEIAKRHNITKYDGVLVVDLTPNGPAAQGGLQLQDIIVSVNGRPILLPEEIAIVVRNSSPGRKITLGILRAGREHTLSIILADAAAQETKQASIPGQEPPAKETPSPAPEEKTIPPRGFLGVSVQALTPESAKEHRLRNTDGALVVAVAPGSPAARAGLAPGDVIRSCYAQRFKTPKDFAEFIARQDPGKELKLFYFRKGQIETATVTIAPPP